MNSDVGFFCCNYSFASLLLYLSPSSSLSSKRPFLRKKLKTHFFANMNSWFFFFCQLFILYLGILILLDSTASPCSGTLLIGHVNIVIIIIIISRLITGLDGCFSTAWGRRPTFSDIYNFFLIIDTFIVSSVRRPSIWRNSVVRWVHPLVGSVYALPHVVISLFRDSDFEDLATGHLLSLGPMCGTLFRPKLDNRVTIYSSSRVNWKHSCSSSPEHFCGSTSNEGPYKYSLLLLLLLIVYPWDFWSNVPLGEEIFFSPFWCQLCELYCNFVLHVLPALQLSWTDLRMSCRTTPSASWWFTDWTWRGWIVRGYSIFSAFTATSSRWDFPLIFFYGICVAIKLSNIFHMESSLLRMQVHYEGPSNVRLFVTDKISEIKGRLCNGANVEQGRMWAGDSHAEWMFVLRPESYHQVSPLFYPSRPAWTILSTWSWAIIETVLT